MDKILIGKTLYTIGVISISAGLTELFSCSEKLKKYTSFAVSLCIVLSLLTPLWEVLSTIQTTLEYENGLFHISDKAPETNTNLKKALEKTINEDVSSKMKIPSDVFYTDIELITKDGETSIEKVTLYVTDISYFRYCERLEAYLNSNYGCKIQIIQQFKE